MSPQDRRTAAALAFAEAAWRTHKAYCRVQKVRLADTAATGFTVSRAWVAEAEEIAAERRSAAREEQLARRDWFALAAQAEAAEHQLAPTSDARRDAILARIAATLPRPDGSTGLDATVPPAGTGLDATVPPAGTDLEDGGSTGP